jgi:O-6-methylguanine DNA methyltransferase
MSGRRDENDVARVAVHTNVGDFEVVATTRGLRAVTPCSPGTVTRPGADAGAALGHANAAAEALRRYAAAEPAGYEGPLDVPASAFQHAVWERLRALSFGSTTTYGELAATLGVPGEARLVGAAVAANPVCILVPCHRVVGVDGSLKGFAWGLALKRRLLAHEGCAALPLFANEPGADLAPRA